MPNLHRRSRLRAGPALVAALAAVVAACGTSEAAPASGVEVTGAWARTTASGATTGVVYLTITGHQTDRLDSLTVDPSIAAAAELHQMVAADGTVVAGSNSGGGGGGHHDHGGSGDDGAAADADAPSGQEQAMIMKPLTGGLAIPSGRDIVLGPGGYHIMLQELARPLAAGDSFPLVLHFQRAGDETVDVEVRTDAP
ncbi:MAG: copper chaperone PCu(A)C [Acidimicrobiales bacterium]